MNHYYRNRGNHSKSHLFYTGIYRCPDDISNLKIRIKLQETVDAKVTAETVATFSWLERKYSAHDQRSNQELSNGVTDTSLPAIYSYTSNGDEEILNTFVDSEDINYFYLENQQQQSDIATLADDDQNRAQILTAIDNPYYFAGTFETMLIMADLGDYVDDVWLKNEQVLCKIRYNSTSQVMSIYPDLTATTTAAEPYCFNEIEKHNTDSTTTTVKNYSYFIENISPQMSQELQLKEREIIAKVINHKNSITKQLVNGLSFELPPPSQNHLLLLRTYLFLEIQLAQQFDSMVGNDLMYVQYVIDLPEGCTCSTPELLEGRTQFSRFKTDNENNRIAHFGHIFELVLDHNLLENSLTGILPAPPCIYLEVVSMDSWHRYRTEGLTYKSIPVCTPGTYFYTLPCVRLCSNNLTDRLRRFFIGDCSNYTDITAIAIPTDHTNASVLNKFSTSTAGTGRIQLKISVVRQSRAFVRDQCVEARKAPARARALIIDQLNGLPLIKSVEQVVQAFRLARKRMIETRKNV